MSDSENSSVPPVIEMTGVTVPSARKPNAPSVKNVNWRVTTGDYWAVVGLESAGKSDLLMLTAGLTSPADGTYRLFGETMPISEGEQLGTRLRLGLVFDDGRLFNHLTLAENVALPLQYHPSQSDKATNETVLEILKFTELLPWANKLPTAIAWSWQKRATLARAIALRPEVLLLDDPLRGLDARHASWWLGFLDKLSSGCDYTRSRPVTLVVAVGALDPWRNRAKQFALLKQGEFSVLGPRENLTKESAGMVAEEFMSGAASI